MAQGRFESNMPRVKSRELQSGFRSFQGLVILVKFLTHRFPRRCKKVAKPPLTSLLTRRNETSSPVYRNRQVRHATPRRRAQSHPCAPSRDGETSSDHSSFIVPDTRSQPHSHTLRRRGRCHVVAALAPSGSPGLAQTAVFAVSAAKATASLRTHTRPSAARHSARRALLPAPATTESIATIPSVPMQTRALVSIAATTRWG